MPVDCNRPPWVDGKDQTRKVHTLSCETAPAVLLAEERGKGATPSQMRPMPPAKKRVRKKTDQVGAVVVDRATLRSLARLVEVAARDH